MIGLDIELPGNCADCPCSYWIKSGEYEGRLMCNALEYRDRNKGKGEYIVDEWADIRPDKCPMYELIISVIK